MDSKDTRKEAEFPPPEPEHGNQAQVFADRRYLTQVDAADQSPFSFYEAYSVGLARSFQGLVAKNQSDTGRSVTKPAAWRSTSCATDIRAYEMITC